MPKVNTAYTFDVALVSQLDTKAFQANPTLAAGDVKISIDEGAFANLASLPTVTPASGRTVKVALTAGEMNGSRIVVQFADVAGAEWCELIYAIETSPDDLTVTAIRTGLGLASANLDTQIAVITAKTNNLPEGLKRNTIFSDFEFMMYSATDHVTAKTGLTVTAQRSIDGSAFAACANSPTEISNGLYKITFAAADLNGTTVTFRFTGTGADANVFTILTSA